MELVLQVVFYVVLEVFRDIRAVSYVADASEGHRHRIVAPIGREQRADLRYARVCGVSKETSCSGRK